MRLTQSRIPTQVYSAPDDPMLLALVLELTDPKGV